MNGKNSSGGLKFFVTKSGLGFEEGVYTQDEIRSLPAAARQYIISLAVAESLGLVTLDHKTGSTVNELDIYAGTDSKTGKQLKLRGVKDGILSGDGKIEAAPQKITNVLREKIQDIKQQSAEESLKAKIEAKKKELNK